MSRPLTCPTCGAAPGIRCHARGGEDDGRPLAAVHEGRPVAGSGEIGRPRAMPPHAVRIAYRMRGNDVPVAAIAERLGVSRATVYRVLRNIAEGERAILAGEPMTTLDEAVQDSAVRMPYAEKQESPNPSGLGL